MSEMKTSAKCLRCGAGAEWIKGKVPDELPEAAESDLLGDALKALEDSARTIERLEAELRVFHPGSYNGSGKARAILAKAKSTADQRTTK